MAPRVPRDERLWVLTDGANRDCELDVDTSVCCSSCRRGLKRSNPLRAGIEPLPLYGSMIGFCEASSKKSWTSTCTPCRRSPKAGFQRTSPRSVASLPALTTSGTGGLRTTVAEYGAEHSKRPCIREMKACGKGQLRERTFAEMDSPNNARRLLFARQPPARRSDASIPTHRIHVTAETRLTVHDQFRPPRPPFPRRGPIPSPHATTSIPSTSLHSGLTHRLTLTLSSAQAIRWQTRTPAPAPRRTRSSAGFVSKAKIPSSEGSLDLVSARVLLA